MEIRERILDKTFELMSRLGVSSVTMDTIAQQCGISKRTLYEQFTDKRTLLQTVLHRLYVQRSLSFSRAIHSAPNKLEAMLSMYFITKEYVATVSEVFINDIERLYPEIQLECREREKLYLHELTRLIEEGQQEGVFRRGFKAAIAATSFTQQMRTVKPSIGQYPEGTTVIEVLDTQFINFMRGIASDKGIKIIDKVLNDHGIKP
ncbi:MAG: TetR/AcrR family transcriptional regulator [Bacteroidales bacterium]|nr:TetR/AcrR family transcriptional regulator [Bacteroidales bacterium]